MSFVIFVVQQKSGHFKQTSSPHTTTNAHGHYHVFGSSALTFNQRVSHHTGTGHPKRVTNRNSTTINVQVFIGNTQLITAVNNLTGKGFIQLTGKDNTREFAEHIGRDGLVDDPSPIADELAMDSAIFFFEKNGLFKLADQGVNDDVIKQITRRVNGGYHGLDDRMKKTKDIYRWLS